jgi:hypothetical protein
MKFSFALSFTIFSLTFTGCSIENYFDDPDDQVTDPVWVTEYFTQVPLPKVDILWVVDTTGSMNEELLSLKSGFVSFVEDLELEQLNYQIGVITTDMSVDGGLLHGNPWIITAELEDPGDSFAEAIDSLPVSVGIEAGLAAFIEALSEPLASDRNRGFRRNDAALHVIVVSDSDDESDDFLNGVPEVDAAKFLTDESLRTGAPAWLSAVVGPEPIGCVGQGGAVVGTAYIAVAEVSGGEVLSICEPELTDLFGGLGSLSFSYSAEFELQGRAAPDSVSVTVNGEAETEGWFVEVAPSRLVFDTPPVAGAQIEIRYRLEDGQ